MQPGVKTYSNTYNVLVKETRDHHVYEWIGNLTLVVDGDGDASFDLTFDGQPSGLPFQDKPQDPASIGLSIECVEAVTIPTND